jgi:putative MATE family efflux protein
MRSIAAGLLLLSLLHATHGLQRGGLTLHARSSLGLQRARLTAGDATAPPPPKGFEWAETPQANRRLRQALSLRRGALDRNIIGIALPSMANLAVIPVVGAVDTFWIGQMGDALALAGQGAANQCFFSLYFLIAFIPTITAPLVAKAAGAGDTDGACTRVCEALFLSNVLGALGMALLVCCPNLVLGLVLPAGAPAASYAANYLRLRSLSLIPALVSAIGFAAFRGTLDTVTPLKVSLASNALNLVLDPILIFGARMGVAGAALATAASEAGAGIIYSVLLLRRRLLRIGEVFKPPKLAALVPLLKGGSAMLLRQAALNVAFVSATRMTQTMDATGVSAAAYSITNQIYSLGLVVMLAVQSSGAALVPSALAAGGEKGVQDARRVADRLIVWSTALATVLAALQALAVPHITPWFSTLPEVRAAVGRPARVSALAILASGPLFAGEGILMGVGAFGYLAGITAVGVGVMVLGLALSSHLGLGVSSVWLSLTAFHIVQSIGTIYHHLKMGPLALGKQSVGSDGETVTAALPNVDCIEMPLVGEVCVVPSETTTPT